MTQNIGEGTLDIPPGWYNASINIFTAEQPGRAGPSLTVNREVLRPGTTLAEHAAEQIEKLRARLKDFRTGEQGRAVLDGRPAQVHEFTWQSDKGLIMHQILVSVQNGERLLNLVATHNAVMERPLRTQMMAILRSFRFNRDTDPGHPR